MLIALVTAVSIVLGFVVPPRWGVWGYVGATLLLFLALVTYLSLRGFEGVPLAESLLLFEGSVAAYIGFNLQVAYRALALPVFALAVVFLVRQQNRRD